MADSVDNARRGILKAIPMGMIAASFPAAAAMASTQTRMAALYADWRAAIADMGNEPDDAAAQLCSHRMWRLEIEASKTVPENMQDVAMLFLMATMDLEQGIRDEDAASILVNLKAILA
jgi:hypothetical protein